MARMADILLAGFLLGGILIQPSICQPKTKCLMYLDEVREILATKVPPINDSRMTDNYYSISRAFFPSVDLPALYVRVTIQFLKDYQNGTKMINDEKRSLKFTWSKACSYVSVKHLSLYAMSVFSLFTIYPQRRESELVMTVPPFCSSSPYAIDDAEENNTWRYVVSTLEDIIVNPKISDPRINSACCVIKGHEGDIDKYPDLWYFYWFILVSSLLASFSLWVLILQCLMDGMKIQDQKNNTRRVCGALLKMTCPVTVAMFLACSVPMWIWSESKAYEKMLYFYLYQGFFFLWLVIGVVWNSKSVTGQCKYLVGSYWLLPGLFQAVHHFLWVICGIISEPFWAIPIFLLECLFAVSILFALFLYENELLSNSKSNPFKISYSQLLYSNGWIVLHLIVCWVSFGLVLVTVALTAVGNGNAVNSPTAGAIEGTMALILVWLVKNSSLDFWKTAKDRNENPQEDEEGNRVELKKIRPRRKIKKNKV